MPWKLVASALLNLAAVVAPVAYYSAKFGVDSHILSGSASSMVAIIVTMAWAFTCASVSAGLLKSGRAHARARNIKDSRTPVGSRLST